MNFIFSGKIPKGEFNFSCLCGQAMHEQLNGKDRQFNCLNCSAIIDIIGKEITWEIHFELLYQSVKHLTLGRYKTWCRIEGLDYAGGNQYDYLEPAVVEITKNLGDEKITDLILIDTKLGHVFLYKGSLEPFKRLLEANHPGWKQRDTIFTM